MFLIMKKKVLTAEIGEIGPGFVIPIVPSSVWVISPLVEPAQVLVVMTTVSPPVTSAVSIL